jgi:phage terminase large subunit GpA-like protein
MDIQRPSPTDLGCPEGMKKCGNGDRLQITCFAKSEDCPINHVILSKTPLLGYESLKLTEDTFLLFTDQHASLPISEFQLTEKSVCLNEKEFAKENEEKLFPLMKGIKSFEGCQFHINDKYDDTERWVLIGS